ncbi:toll/interleukin-1 receptor domain-containing protein [Bacteroides sp. CR5/BHMF/2]|nr:toll/interleukin-1 receptor domain-containing protein [Bacteroides sp. CR5/BHMF/2]
MIFIKIFKQAAIFCFLFWKTDHQDIDADILKILIDNGDAVFPIYFGEKFENEVPKVIRIMNGKRYIVDDHEKYVNYAFESMKLLRENRKLFISYRRTDSSAVANQLFDAFVRSNYDVFLDTYSINPAKNFQEELHHRMTDCDVLIQLYTNDFKNSEWCNEEITSANQKQIGVVEVVWPDCNPDIHNLLCEPIQLSEEFLLTKISIMKIVVSQRNLS